MNGVEWPDGLKTRAVALCIETGNISEATRRLAQEFPDQAPSVRCVNQWVHKIDPNLYQQIANNKAAIAQARWVDIELGALDAVEAKIEEGKMDGKDLAIVAGISADKRLAVEQMNARYKGGNRFALFKMMAKMEEGLKAGGTVEAQAVLVEGEMP